MMERRGAKAWLGLVCALFGCVALSGSGAVARDLRADEIIQPVQAYLLPLRGLEGTAPEYGSPFRDVTHIASDYGTMGPGEKRLTWSRGDVHADLRDAGADQLPVLFSCGDQFPG